MPQWIWKFGEFETYHNQLVHNRRTQYGYAEPPVWKVFPPDSVVRFTKTVTTQGGEIRVTACGSFAVTVGTGYHDQQKHGGRPVITLPPGTTTISITVSNPDTFPCLFVDGAVCSGEGWLADDLAGEATPVGSLPWFNTPGKTPEVFPFEYQPIACAGREAVPGGVLFDFGRETFARTAFTLPGDAEVTVSYGESREEALDTRRSVIHTTRRAEGGRLAFPAQAFRYIFVSDAQAEVAAQYEFLPLEQRGSFRTGEEVVDRVWDVAAYTFHLNCREFFLDGIKRDRWVWAADTYQCLFVNRYLFLDAAIEQRTLIALGGKRPFTAHINTIMDYTFFWVISLWEHYQTYGDKTFLRQIAPQLEAVMTFCRGRVDADGFVRGRPGDWVFIDWAPMDKTGALCGEQVLFAKALECYSAICGTLGAADGGAREQARALQRAVEEHFFDKELGAYVDSYESGKKNITRHSNILAYLFLPLDAERKTQIYQNVVLNDDVRQITTPYFKFYENQVHCEEGNPALLEASIRDYYGGMLATGATTLYEEFDPTVNGAEHYAMYGNPFEKSLCHAWSASPIYLLGRYRMGVRNTGIAYDSFEVAPMLGDLETFSGVVPLPGGEVRVEMDAGRLRVTATAPGGTLVFGGRRVELEAGRTAVVNQHLCP